MLRRGHSYLLGDSFSPEQACGLNRICHFLLVPTSLAIVVVSKVNTSPEPGQSYHPFPGPQRIVQRWTSTKSKMDQQEPPPGVARVSDLWRLRCDLWGDTQPQWGRGGRDGHQCEEEQSWNSLRGHPEPFLPHPKPLPGSSDRFLSSTIRRGLVHAVQCPNSAISGEVSAVLSVKRWLGCISHCPPARISSQLLTQVTLHVIPRLAKPNTDLFSKFSVVCLEKRRLCFLCHCNALFWWFRNSR